MFARTYQISIILVAMLCPLRVLGYAMAGWTLHLLSVLSSQKGHETPGSA